MGQNLSNNYSKTKVNTSQDVISEPIIHNNIILAYIWLGSAYAMMMIWTTTILYDRWLGRNRLRRVGTSGVIAAIFFSSLWPIVLLSLAIPEREVWVRRSSSVIAAIANIELSQSS